MLWRVPRARRELGVLRSPVNAAAELADPTHAAHQIAVVHKKSVALCFAIS